jgi:hypothetical protein
VGSIRRSFSRQGSATVANVPRVARVLRAAGRARRIPAGAPIYMTEFGFQSRPPDRFGLRPNDQARAINEADRLMASSSRVRMVAQYELRDDPQLNVFNTGLSFVSGRRKPAYEAYRLPLVVTRSTRSRDVVEVWGWVRPARDAQRVTVVAGRAIVAQPGTNNRGQFSIRVRRRGASRLRYRFHWQAPSGAVLQSRLASPGAPLRFLR